MNDLYQCKYIFSQNEKQLAPNSDSIQVKRNQLKIGCKNIALMNQKTHASPVASKIKHSNKFNISEKKPPIKKITSVLKPTNNC